MKNAAKQIICGECLRSAIHFQLHTKKTVFFIALSTYLW